MDDTEVGPKLAAARLEQAQLECQRLTFELARLRSSSPWYQKPLQLLPMLTASISLLAFAFSVVVYTLNQSANAESSRKAAANQFMKPWIESQWETYAQALSAASTVATSDDAEQRRQAERQFLQLFYGRMVMVETKEVSDAMRTVKGCFEDPQKCLPVGKYNLVLGLASQMAKSMQETAGMTYEKYLAQRYDYIDQLRRSKPPPP